MMAKNCKASTRTVATAGPNTTATTTATTAAPTRATAPVAQPSPAESAAAPFTSEQDQISENIKAILAFYTREEENISGTQRVVERVSGFIGRPVFLGIILLFVAAWIIANVVTRHFGHVEFDPAPYFWLQGILGLGALLTANVVLTTQNRLAQLEEKRAHLDLKVTLLTEQKAAKLIDLLEELRRDLPNVRDRHDPEVAALQQAMNPDQVLAALDERSKAEAQPVPAAAPVKVDVAGQRS
jgi:uncharacterized membrane protein